MSYTRTLSESTRGFLIPANMTTAEQTRYFKLRYHNNPDFRERRLLANRKWKSKNKHKLQAEHKIAYMIKSGKMKRGRCKICNKIAQAHHPDYSEPFRVEWLCPQHHTQEHKNIISLNQETTVRAVGAFGRSGFLSVLTKLTRIRRPSVSGER